MTVEEARAWLRGDRSTTNMMMSVAEQDRQTTLTRIAQADAAHCQQAYYVLAAHGLLPIGEEQP